jgi:hypothetical protein
MKEVIIGHWPAITKMMTMYPNPIESADVSEAKVGSVISLSAIMMGCRHRLASSRFRLSSEKEAHKISINFAVVFSSTIIKARSTLKGRFSSPKGVANNQSEAEEEAEPEPDWEVVTVFFLRGPGWTEPPEPQSCGPRPSKQPPSLKGRSPAVQLYIPRQCN